MLLFLPRIPPVSVHIVMLLVAMSNMHGNTHSMTMLSTGSGSASSLVRSMKNAREDPQAREKTDTTTPTIIDGGNLPGIRFQKNGSRWFIMAHVSGVKFFG